MGKMTLNKINKNCGNCAYWCGERTIDTIRKCVVVETGTSGKCGKKLAPMLYNAACNNYELHPICK